MVDTTSVDFNEVEYPRERIREFIPQRFEMEQLSAVVKVLREEQIGIAYRDVRDDEFWCRGHIPERPLFPGVLMLEAAAQLSTFLYKVLSGDAPDRFLGFGGVDKVKFRQTVVPGQRLVIVAKMIEARSRRCMFETQGILGGKLVFEATITGVPV
jgi:3-hydroxyacyl-[acyl-carrier-protein] dehydratase